MPGEGGVPVTPTTITITNHATVISGEGKNLVTMATAATLPRQPTMKRKGSI